LSLSGIVQPTFPRSTSRSLGFIDAFSPNSFFSFHFLCAHAPVVSTLVLGSARVCVGS
jgi:hypothetical protein